MINVGEINKLPSKATNYDIVKILILLTLPALVFLVFGLASTGNQSGLNFFPVFSKAEIVKWFFILWLLIELLIGLPFIIRVAIDNKYTTFVVNTNKIDINWGLVIKKSKSIPFSAVQNIKIESGVFTALCGVKIINIWTSSQSQISNDSETGNRPDGVLVLTSENSKWLSDFITAHRT